MEFTASMLKKAMARRNRSDQIDKHIISLASGISYNDLGLMSQRDYAPLLDELRVEVMPSPIRLVWNDADGKWVISLCSCECVCDECGMFIVCVPCECGGKELARFREVLQNDIERANTQGTPDYLTIVEIVTGLNVSEWRLKDYKTVEMGVARSTMAPLVGMPDSPTSSVKQD